jgi:predicted transcriptional regulator
MPSFPELRSIALRRRRLGLTQSALAKSVGISQSMLNKVEREIAVPNYDIATAIFGELDRLEHRDEKNAGDVMHKGALLLRMDDTLERAARLAKEKSISQFPVVDRKGAIVGGIRTADLMDFPKGAKICWRVGAPFPTVGKNTPLSAVNGLLRHEQAVVVVEKGKAIGMITAEDLL